MNVTQVFEAALLAYIQSNADEDATQILNWYHVDVDGAMRLRVSFVVSRSRWLTSTWTYDGDAVDLIRHLDADVLN